MISIVLPTYKGSDIVDKLQFSDAKLVQGFVEKLPFDNNSFDMVTCSRTLKHSIKERLAIKELLRLAKRQLIVVAPCQRYFYHTPDEYVNFYLFKEKLFSLSNLKNYICKKANGDRTYIGMID